MIAHGLAASLWLLSAHSDLKREAPQVQDCPTQRQVAAAVFSASGKTPAPDTLTWEVIPSLNLVRVRVTDVDDPTELREFRLNQQACPDLAQSIAVVWVGAHMHAQEVAIDVPAFEVDPETPLIETNRAVEPKSAPTTTVAKRAMPNAPTTPASMFIEAEGAALATWSGVNGAASGHLGFALAFPGQTGFRLSAEHVGSMRTPLGPGQAQWRRWNFALGLFQRWHIKTTVFELEPALVVSRLQMAGVGYSSNAQGFANDIGGRLSARLAWHTTKLSPMLLFSSDGWFGQRELWVMNLPSLEEVPRWTIACGVGLMWGNSKIDSSR